MRPRHPTRPRGWRGLCAGYGTGRRACARARPTPMPAPDPAPPAVRLPPASRRRLPLRSGCCSGSRRGSVSRRGSGSGSSPARFRLRHRHRHRLRLRLRLRLAGSGWRLAATGRLRPRPPGGPLVVRGRRPRHRPSCPATTDAAHACLETGSRAVAPVPRPSRRTRGRGARSRGRGRAPSPRRRRRRAVAAPRRPLGRRRHRTWLRRRRQILLLRRWHSAGPRRQQPCRRPWPRRLRPSRLVQRVRPGSEPVGRRCGAASVGAVAAPATMPSPSRVRRDPGPGPSRRRPPYRLPSGRCGARREARHRHRAPAAPATGRRSPRRWTVHPRSRPPSAARRPLAPAVARPPRCRPAARPRTAPPASDGHSGTPSYDGRRWRRAPEDPGCAGVAVRRGAPAPRPRRGVRRPVGRLRALPPAARATTSSWSAGRTSTARRSWSPPTAKGSRTVRSPTTTTSRSARTSSGSGSRTTCSRARRRSTTSASSRTCSGRCTSTARSSSSEMLVSFSAGDRPHAARPLHRGHVPDLRLRGGARRPVRQLRQPARPDRPDQPALEDRRLDAGVPRDEAPLPRPAAVRRPAADVDRSATTTGARTSRTSRSASSTSSGRGRSRATSTGASAIPVPGYAEDENKRIYVWFDAVIGYLSASIEWAAITRRARTPGASGGRTPTREHYYFQGKDNIVFHTVIWPAMLLGYGAGRRVRRRARAARPARQRRRERVPDDGGQAVLDEPRLRRSTSATSSTATTPTRCATTSSRRARRRRTPTSPGPSSCAATTTSCSRTGATSSTAR